jgi:hypothetical protein
MAHTRKLLSSILLVRFISLRLKEILTVELTRIVRRDISGNYMYGRLTQWMINLNAFV